MNFLARTVVLLLMTCIFHSTLTSAITCYQCSDCFDPFDYAKYSDSTVPDCTSCKKLIGTTNGFAVVDRGCGRETYYAGCDSESESDTSGTYCECVSELCNAASSIIGSLHITVLAVFLAAVYGLRRHA